MEVHCEGCAGCCMDWRPLLEEADSDRSQRRSPFDRDADDGTSRAPLDGDTNFVPLTREEVRGFLDDGMAAALTPRFWRARDEAEGVEIDGHSVAAVAGRPVFFVGLRKPPKPVAPFDRDEPSWLPTCVFLDPETLQCRIHDSDRFPDECGAYPAHNLALEQETECERVEDAFGGERLLDDGDDDVPADLDGLLLGSQALGAKLFAHPNSDALEGIVERAAAGELTAADRAECLAVAAASSPGTLAISDHHYEWGRERTLEATADDGSTERDDGADSWVGAAIDEWYRRSRTGESVPSPSVADEIETARGAPETPGWDALE
ncbi:YkgJ family cysteine cluster protein [Natronolimnohabitans innermongolicus]|uniref:Uncharacterized protein n=1 Tax=Natronolimnohabitans innermongolicus JCM 12255 TaxID=1227499 RepID=L9X5R1_9EURY|nr:YkgJ family cysteine cluster protein [Natronolimnohabitans innermongolicus]ELY55928.1 hypothetical protein C493_10633 [Natronolimnohabitans innermongolicus JCM 12255]